MNEGAASVHASAVLIGPRAALLRGPAGIGKSALVLELIEAARVNRIVFARLVADDRVHLSPAHGRLLARPAPALAGRIEVRGVGIQELPYEPVAVVGWIVDLTAAASERMPERRKIAIQGVNLPHLTLARGPLAVPRLLAAMQMSDRTPM